MQFYSKSNKEQFIKELKGLTTDQTPSMYKERTEYLFWGRVTEDGFEIKSNNRVIPNLVEINAEVCHQKEGTLIELNIKQLYFPLWVYLLAAGFWTFVQLITSINKGDFFTAILSVVYGTAAILLMLFIAKIQGQLLIRKFETNTSANKV